VSFYQPRPPPVAQIQEWVGARGGKLLECGNGVVAEPQGSVSMSSIVGKGIVRGGQVELVAPINLPDGSEVTVVCRANGNVMGLPDKDRPMTSAEIADTLAAMARVEPFEMTDEERREADVWEKQVNDHTKANLDTGIEDVFR
jgi:hypothetical protein